MRTFPLVTIIGLAFLLAACGSPNADSSGPLRTFLVGLSSHQDQRTMEGGLQLMVETVFTVMKPGDEAEVFATDTLATIARFAFKPGLELNRGLRTQLTKPEWAKLVAHMQYNRPANTDGDLNFVNVARHVGDRNRLLSGRDVILVLLGRPADHSDAMGRLAPTEAVLRTSGSPFSLLGHESRLAGIEVHILDYSDSPTPPQSQAAAERFTTLFLAGQGARVVTISAGDSQAFRSFGQGLPGRTYPDSATPMPAVATADPQRPIPIAATLPTPVSPAPARPANPPPSEMTAAVAEVAPAVLASADLSLVWNGRADLDFVFFGETGESQAVTVDFHSRGQRVPLSPGYALFSKRRLSGGRHAERLFIQGAALAPERVRLLARRDDALGRPISFRVTGHLNGVPWEWQGEVGAEAVVIPLPAAITTPGPVF